MNENLTDTEQYMALALLRNRFNQSRDNLRHALRLNHLRFAASMYADAYEWKEIIHKLEQAWGK